MKEGVKAAVRQVLTTYLEQNKCRKTPERFAVLDAVYGFSCHFSMQELYDKLEQDNFPISRATLYNTINLFIKLRLVISHRLQGRTVYEACYTKKDHCYQICTVCGKESEVKTVGIAKFIDDMHLKRFRKDGFQLYLYGVCSTCQAKITRQKRTMSK